MKGDTSTYLKVDKFIPEYEFGMYGNCVKGIWVYIGGTGHYFECDRYIVCDPNIARETGRRQVVELVKELAGMKFTDKNELFDYCSAYDIISHFSYDEIVEKLDAWKKEKEAIRVRDEAYSQTIEAKFVVTKIYTPIDDGDVIVNGLKKDGTAIKGLLLCNLKKTGLHVDDLDSYLEV